MATNEDFNKMIIYDEGSDTFEFIKVPTHREYIEILFKEASIFNRKLYLMPSKWFYAVFLSSSAVAIGFVSVLQTLGMVCG